ncbi:hypothetical protein [Nostoc sp.]
MNKILLTVPAFIISITASNFDLAKGVPIDYDTSYKTVYTFYKSERKTTEAGRGQGKRI